MTIKFYKNYSDYNVMDKNITQVGPDVDGVIKEDSPLINPVFVIQDFTNFDPATCNYCYIAAFNRYYYINETILLTDKLYELHMHVDVLMSFKSGIRGNNAVISRQANKYNLYLNDGVYKTLAYPAQNIIKFPTGFGSENFVLAVAGG